MPEESSSEVFSTEETSEEESSECISTEETPEESSGEESTTAASPTPGGGSGGGSSTIPQTGSNWWSVLLLVALGRSLWYVHENQAANEAITEVAAKLDDVLPEQPTGVLLADEIMQEVPEREMPVVEIDGYYYIGKLEVPSIGLELPVMETWDYSLLKIAPCRYSGSVYTDDMIIAGHNYRKHFSPLKWVDPGTEILFTDAVYPEM